MKAKAAAAAVRKKRAGKRSTRAAVKALAEGGLTSRNARKNLRQDIGPAVRRKVMSKKKAQSARRPVRGTQSQTHHPVR